MTQQALRPAKLESEAEYLYHSLFQQSPGPEITAAYVRAHDYICASSANAASIATVVDQRLDVEALELVLRRRRPLLTRKLRILLYLAEVTPKNYHRFVNPTNRRVRGWVLLAGGVLRTAYKYMQGRAILARNSDLLRD